jgi:pseudouridylate synthase
MRYQTPQARRTMSPLMPVTFSPDMTFRPIFSPTVRPDVAEALAHKEPVVALESTLITHGLPWPKNIETARAAEAAVREAGALPCTIAILDGKVTIGLDDSQLLGLAQAPNVRKVSRRDMALTVAQGQTGATTVAATMLCASWAGIEVFATGGIGGVHRGADATFDISADLTELGRTRTTVVCAGAKIILDLPRTLEVLETAGVPIIGFGTDEFPGFFMASTGLPVDERIDDVKSLAEVIRTQRQMGLGSGILVAQPPPPELSLEPSSIESWLDTALKDAANERITGKALTPFLLNRMADLSGGVTLTTNLGLIQSNAALGGRLSVALASE